MRRGRPERFIVTIDDDQEFIFMPDTVLKYGISLNKQFSDEEFLEIIKEDHLQQAKDQAMRYLSARSHSRQELIQKLRRKGYQLDVIHCALNDLEKIDLLNDEQFARLFIQNEIRLRLISRELLRHKLLSKGISRDFCDSLLEEMYPAELENEIIRTLTEKFIKLHSHYQGKELKKRLVNFLRNKGFQWDLIHQVLLKFNLMN